MKTVFAAWLLLFVFCIFGSACVAAEPPPPPPLNELVERLIAAAKLKNATVGVSVIEVKSGQILCGIRECELIPPASNLKLITTGSALLLLGPQFQFTTSIYASGAADDQGVLEGDIVLVAGGDPAISGREHGGNTTVVFDALAAEVAKSTRTVRGNLVIDDTIFDREYIHPSWPKDQLTSWYCAPVSAFALNDNCIDVFVKPGSAVGAAAQVTLDPPTGYFEVKNTCGTVASGKSGAYISRLPDCDTLVISGKLTPKASGASSPVTVVNPALFAATVLRERLAAAGVRVEGQIVFAEKAVDTAGMKALAAVSHSLASAVSTANKRSQNFYAEMILKTAGRRVATPSSFAAGVRAVAMVLDKAGIKQGTYVMEDGSGLSKRNAFSAIQLATFLRYMAFCPGSAEIFFGSLPVSGTDGTLRERMGGPQVAGKVFAKTGHVSGVSALSGYAKCGETLLAFSILITGEGLNQSAANALQDSICGVLVDTPSSQP